MAHDRVTMEKDGDKVTIEYDEEDDVTNVTNEDGVDVTTGGGDRVREYMEEYERGGWHQVPGS